jgi:hypothetical protein
MREQPVTSQKPIFFDETGSRWRVSRMVLFSIAAALLILPIVLALSILKVGVLPERASELPQAINGSHRQTGNNP